MALPQTSLNTSHKNNTIKDDISGIVGDKDHRE